MTNNYSIFLHFLKDDLRKFDYDFYLYGIDHGLEAVNRIDYINLIFKYLKNKIDCTFYCIQDSQFISIFSIGKVNTRYNSVLGLVVTKIRIDNPDIITRESHHSFTLNNYGIRKLKILIYKLLKWI